VTLGRDLLVAVMFLTRLPARSSTPWEDGDLASSVIMFPIIGSLVGLLSAGVYAFLFALGLPPFLSASIALSALIAVTGALHEDGLADIADGFGGGKTRDDKLRIMRDSTLGSYGVLSLGLSLLMRVGALAALAHPSIVAIALIVTGALSRAALPIAMTIMNQARTDGLASKAGQPHPGRAGSAAVIAILIAFFCLPFSHAFTVTFVSSLCACVFLLLAQRQVGGITGDVLGALQQIVEISGLIALVALANSA